MMRRLGFAPDEIYFVVNKPGTVIIENGAQVTSDKFVIVLMVKAQGLEFNWTIGETEVPDDHLADYFEKACEDWNRACDTPELDKAFKASTQFRSCVPLVQALQSKGFVIRKWN